jgi:hypothetical protein
MLTPKILFLRPGHEREEEVEPSLVAEDSFPFHRICKSIADQISDLFLSRVFLGYAICFFVCEHMDI